MMVPLQTVGPMVLLLLVIGGVAGVLAALLVPAFFYTFEPLGYSGAQLVQVCMAASVVTSWLDRARKVIGW